ncbi:MAG: EAL domain-containing response regulator [Pseudomonadota bacterium]
MEGQVGSRVENRVQKILCVDDQPANLLALDAIVELPGVELLKATSGAEALEMLLANDNIALALLDVQMAEMDGYEVAELMRTHRRSRKIPIIFLTAINTDIRHVFQGYDAGAVDYIFKPVEPRILLSKIEFFLDLDLKSRQLEDTLAEVRALRENTEALLRSVGEGIVSVGADGLVSFANPAAATMLGRTPNEMVGRRLVDFVEMTEASATLRWADTPLWRACSAGNMMAMHGMSGWLVAADGARIPAEITASAVRNEQGDVSGAALVFQDVSQRREYEEKLVRLAEYDNLTGLANRYLCLNLMAQATARATRAGHSVGVLFLDLDRFKQVNDTLGHQAGDDLLREVAQRLKLCVREGDTVCRLGGDEFVIVVEGLNAGKHAAAVADKVIRALADPFIVLGTPQFVGASIGIVTFPETEGDPNTLLRCADIAMYQAKQRGRNNFQFFTPHMQDEVLRAQALEQNLRRALAAGEFELWYQPQISTHTGAICGLEALVRWRTPDGQLLEPEQFISRAEETGLIVELGEWVLREATARAARWHREGLLDVPVAVSVNLSIRQVRGRSVLETVSDILSRLDLRPDQLMLEITEHMVMDEPEAMLSLLAGIRRLGVRIALDDFGVGYSSFDHLRRMPLDALKIDRSFVEDVAASGRTRDVVRAITALGHSLGIQVVGEAVETAAQRDALRELGVDALQGFCLCRPLTAAQLEAELPRLRNQTFPG